MIDRLMNSEKEATEYIGRKVTEKKTCLSRKKHIETYPNEDAENCSCGNTESGNNR